MDLLSQVTGVGDYERIRKNSVEITIFGHECKVISLEDLIQSKQSLRRQKDLEVARELELIREKNQK